MAKDASTPLTDPFLIGEKLSLRPMEQSDVPLWHAWYLRSDPSMLDCSPQPILSLTVAEEEFKNEEPSDRSQRFMVVRSKDDAIVGHIEFFNLNPLNRSAELSVLIDPDERREEVASEALFILCKYLFRQRGLNKVYVKVSSLNTAAIELLESSEFKRDGVLRHHYFYRGEYHNQLIFSLLLYEFDG